VFSLHIGSYLLPAVTNAFPWPNNLSHLHATLEVSSLQMQKQFPTRDQAGKYVDQYLARVLASTDAIDLIFYMNASHNYDPLDLFGTRAAHC